MYSIPTTQLQLHDYSGIQIKLDGNLPGRMQLKEIYQTECIPDSA